MRVPPALCPDPTPLDERILTTTPAALARKKAEMGKKKRGWERRGLAVLKIPLKYHAPGLTKITVIMFSRHHRRLLARCTIQCPYCAGRRNAFVDTELLTEIRVLSIGITKHNKLSHKFRTLRFWHRSIF